MRPMVLFAALLLVTACDSKSSSTPGADTAPAEDTRVTEVSPLPEDTTPALDTAAPQDTPAPPDTPAANVPVEIGDKVPDFSLPATGGQTFTLSDHKGKRVLISAFPAATTAVCTIQTCYVNDNLALFTAANTVPVGLSTDVMAKLDEWSEEEQYQQLLLSDADPKGAVSEMLGIYDMLGVTSRANLILDENRVLVWRKVYAMGETPNFEEVHAFLDGME